jgi:hypothetical protein
MDEHPYCARCRFHVLHLDKDWCVLFEDFIETVPTPRSRISLKRLKECEEAAKHYDWLTNRLHEYDLFFARTNQAMEKQEV